MKNQFSLVGLALLTPEIKELISLSESADFRAVKKMRVDEMRAQIAQHEKKLFRLEAAGLLLPGAWEAVAPKLETILAAYESGLKTDNETALKDAQESDCKTVQDAYNAWLYTARPTPAQALLGAAKMRAEMRAAGIIETGPGPAPIGNSVSASSPIRPTPAGESPAHAVDANPPHSTQLTPAAIVGPPLASAIGDKLSANYNPIKAPFTLAQIDELAKAVELIDKNGKYASPRGRKGLGAVVGFAEALYLIGAVSRPTCNRKKLTGYLGHHFGVEVSTNDAGTDIAKDFIEKTVIRAKTLFPDLFKPEKRKESE